MRDSVPKSSVLATSLLALAAAAQEPAIFEPKTDAELQAFLNQVVRVEAQAFAPVGGLWHFGEPNGTPVTVTDPERIHALCSDWSPETGGSPPDRGWNLRIEFVDKDGRHTRATLGALAWIGAGLWQMPEATTKSWRALREDSLCEPVRTIEQLRALPPTRTSLECRMLPVDLLQSELPRFRGLAHLAVDLDDRMTALLASLRTVESLEITLRATPISEPAWQRLARLPKLRHLTVTAQGALPDPRGIAGLTRLESLAITQNFCGDPPVSLELLTAIATLANLVEVRVGVHCPRGSEAAQHETFAKLLGLPKLRRLALATGNENPRGLWPLLVDAPLERLHLTDMVLDVAGIDALAAMPALRELDLRGARLSRSALDSLGLLQQLSRLDLRGSGAPPDQCAAAQILLGSCDVIGPADRKELATLGGVLMGASSWTYR